MPDHETTAPEPVGEKAPVAINPSTFQSVAIAVALACITAYGAVSNLMIYWSTRDIAGFIVWLRSSDFLQVLSALSMIGGIGGIIFRTMRRKARELYLNRHTAPSISYLKGSAADPALATRAREATMEPPTHEGVQ